MVTPLTEVKECQQLFFFLITHPADTNHKETFLFIYLFIYLFFIAVKYFEHCQAHIAHLIAAAMLNFTTHDQHIKPQVAAI